MSLSCYIIDDEFHAVELLRSFVEKTPGLELAGTSTKPPAALQAVRELSPAVVFLDVDMPDLSGLDLAGMISRDTTVVFTTSYREFAPEAFEKDAADYLLKPIGYARFLSCIEKIRRKNPDVLPAKRFFLVKTGTKGSLARIDPNELIYISGLEAYVELHLRDKKLVTYIGLAELLEQLPAATFSRIHKSYVVNHDFITGIESGQVLLPGPVRLTIGRAYREEFFRKLAPALLISKRDQA
jgi:two-component system LytT family response regulator